MRRLCGWWDEHGCATGELYEDAGEGFGYRSGHFRRLALRYKQGKLEAQTEGSFSPPKRQPELQIYGLPA